MKERHYKNLSLSLTILIGPFFFFVSAIYFSLHASHLPLQHGFPTHPSLGFVHLPSSILNPQLARRLGELLLSFGLDIG
jgi:hypothetical protein